MRTPSKSSRADVTATRTEFVAALCHRAATKAMKTDAASRGWKNAFEKKGAAHRGGAADRGTDEAPTLVTFKRGDDARDDFRSALALFTATSWGAVDDDALVTRARALAKRDGTKPHLHVVDGAPPPVDRGAFAPAGAPLKSGDDVVTLLSIGDGDKASRWATHHVHDDATRAPFPANKPALALPADAPSRAWLKLEEAIARFRLAPKSGERALEIGSAPGGATFALLARGLDVVGVDPNDMAPVVASHARFTHARQTSFSLPPDAVRGPFHWLLLDVNVPPGTAFRGALPHLAHHASTLRGFVLTLKLPTWEGVAELDGWLRRIERAASSSGAAFRIDACSLWSGGQELCCVGVRA